MFHSWREYRHIKKSIVCGQLNEACSRVRRLKRANAAEYQPLFGKQLVKRLIDQLVSRSEKQSVVGDFPAAWRDIVDAGSIATVDRADTISRKTNQLVEKTIEQAERLIGRGKTDQANDLVQILNKRRIMDRRADRIRDICRQVAVADQLVAKGQSKHAKSLLQRVKEQHPELAFLDFKIKACDSQQFRLAELTGQLKTAINESAWGGVEEVTHRMLSIAPRHQIAIDALQRCHVKSKKGSTDTTRQRLVDTKAGVSKQPSSATFHIGMKSQPDEPSSLANDSFLLWIDGVGGFLICTKPEITIGQAVISPQVDVPVQADIRRRHLKIRRLDGEFLADPLGSVVCDGKNLETTTLLGDQEILDLGAGVHIKFKKTHPLGNSSLLEFTSRHRTEPWSDAVILMGDAIMLGPGTDNHIICPNWKDQFVIYRNEDQICFRGPANYEVDGHSQKGDVALKPNMRISGEDFSITCERT